MTPELQTGKLWPKEVRRAQLGDHCLTASPASGLPQTLDSRGRPTFRRLRATLGEAAVSGATHSIHKH